MYIRDDFAGGSLNDVIALDDRIIKRYSGPISRGSDKLHAERQWLLSIPLKLNDELPLLFPKLLHFKDEPRLRLTEIHVSRIPRISLSKAILRHLITPDKALSFLKVSLDVLMNELYPIRSSIIRPRRGYIQYHSNRLALARKYLRRLPYMEPILNAAKITVNGIICPSINQFLSWLDANAHKIFISETVMAIHGNFHLDNILIDIKNCPNSHNVSFVDPRGDLLGYPHYDIAKLLITLEGYYDEIHYGGYTLDPKIRGNSYDIVLQVNEQASFHYQNCLQNVTEQIKEFAKAERVTMPQFLWLIYTTECIHILSFCFYHAYRLDTDPNRIRAFVAIFALLVRRLFDMWTSNSPIEIPKIRLPIKEGGS